MIKLVFIVIAIVWIDLIITIVGIVALLFLLLFQMKPNEFVIVVIKLIIDLF